MNNYFELKMPVDGRNEAFARSVVAAFSLPCSPDLDRLNDLKTAVSEAVTNAIVHAYPDGKGEVTLSARIDEKENSITVTVSDSGVGIADVSKAIEPFYTTKPDEERSGMGFTIIDAFSDEMTVLSSPGKGVSVTMKKIFARC